MIAIERAKLVILEHASSNSQFSLRAMWTYIGSRLMQQHIGYATYTEAFIELLAVDKKIFSLMERNSNGQALFGLWES